MKKIDFLCSYIWNIFSFKEIAMPLGQIIDDDEFNYEEKNHFKEYNIRLFNKYIISLLSRIEAGEKFDTIFGDFLAIFTDDDYGINLQFSLNGCPLIHYNYKDNVYHGEFYGIGDALLNRIDVVFILMSSFIRKAEPLTPDNVIDVLLISS